MMISDLVAELPNIWCTHCKSFPSLLLVQKSFRELIYNLHYLHYCDLSLDLSFLYRSNLCIYISAVNSNQYLWPYWIITGLKLKRETEPNHTYNNIHPAHSQTSRWGYGAIYFFFPIVDWGQKMEKKNVHSMTLLLCKELTSGSHRGYLRAQSGQWAAAFKKLSEADGERVQRLQGGQQSSTLLIGCVCLRPGQMRCGGWGLDGWWWCPLAIYFPVFGEKNNSMPCWASFCCC